MLMDVSVMNISSVDDILVFGFGNNSVDFVFFNIILIFENDGYFNFNQQVGMKMLVCVMGGCVIVNINCVLELMQMMVKDWEVRYFLGFFIDWQLIGCVYEFKVLLWLGIVKGWIFCY